jgi:signal transduction histidine kinase/DNA-binding response OmpR family regulator
MIDFIANSSSSDGFMPHGHCYLWQPGVLWLHLISDSLITLAYFSIPITLVYFVRKRKDLEFNWMFVCFAVFILACGTTHLMEIWNIWHADYWLSGSIKAITALASIPTAILLVRLVPTALALPSPSALATINEQLQREITVRKRTEHTLHQKNIDLKNATLAKSRFLATMSHELRTPLNAIIGFSEVLKDGLFGELSQKQNTYISQIFNSGQHLLALINDILDLSKIEAGKMTLDMDEVALNKLLQACLDDFTDRAAKRDIALRFEAYEGNDCIVADERKLRQIVYNLLSNAVKFTPDGGEVRLSWHPVKRSELRIVASESMATRQLPLPPSEFEEFIEIRVSDDGIGMSSQDLPNLFQTFVQLDSSLTRQHEGTGLGLNMVSRLAELHGGTVGVASAPGQGTHFVVWLPWRKTKANDLIASPDLADSIDTPSLQKPALQVLVIENDQSAAELLRIHLESAGFQVRWATDAASALDLAKQQPPDLITLDLLLPDASGWEVLDQIKTMPLLDAVPVVIVSILADEMMETQKGFALGVAKMLQKPVARKTLLDAIATLGLGDGEASGSTVLVIDDDPQAIELVTAHLQDQNCKVLHAYNGYSALDIARQTRPDLIILDLMLPDISGFDVADTLKRQLNTASVPILVLTAKTITKQERERLSGFVLKIMEKGSFNRQQFIAEVHRALFQR